MTRRCIYAGSFDPLTNGHLWMIKEGAKLFDDLIVAVGVNPDKKSFFTKEKRLKMLHYSTDEFKNVTVDSFGNRFLVDYAKEKDAAFILRGIRTGTDYEYERGMRHLNEQINPNVTTVFLSPPRNLSETSSSMVKGLIGPTGWEKIIQPHVPPAVYNELLITGLWPKFNKLWTEMCGTDSTNIFEVLVSRYSEPHRHYHTLRHIASCLSLLETSICYPDRSHLIELAIWFHDVVYNTQSNTNEEDSALLFSEAVKGSKIHDIDRDTVMAYIRASETHDPPDMNTNANRLFLDIDLSILGSTPEEFREYDSQIRKEYEWVPSEAFYPRRFEILNGMLSKPSIFLTPEFKDRFEKQARKNISHWCESHALLLM